MEAPVLTVGVAETRFLAYTRKFLRRVKGCSLRDQIMNEGIGAELRTYSMNDRIRQCSLQWKQHL